MGVKMKIGSDKLGGNVLRKKIKQKKKGSVYKSPYERLLSEIEKIKTAEQVSIVAEMIQGARSDRRITYAQCNLLSSKLNEKTSKVGEKEKTIKLGPLGEFGVKSKGKVK
jgi:hypothetical protein